MKYFHELTEEQLKSLIKQGGHSYSEFEQPDWCDETNALDWVGGCWSLTELKIKKRADCLNCDFCKQ